MEALFGKLGLENLITDDFIVSVKEKYHYQDSDISKLRAIGFSVRNCIKDQERFELVDLGENKRLVSITLGKTLDALSLQHAKKQELTEQLMVDNISAELLMNSYELLDEFIHNKTNMHLTNMIFFGDTSDYPLEKMPEYGKMFMHIDVEITPEAYLIPSKTVIYIGEMSDCENAKTKPCNRCPKRFTCETRIH